MWRLRKLIDRSRKLELGDAAGCAVGAPAASSRSEYLDGAFQRLPHAPGQGNAEEAPDQRALGVEPAEPDTVGTRRSRLARTRRCRLQLGDLGIAHVPFFFDRLDQVVADQARDQHGA